jgi:hypothetical protein
MGDPTLVVKPCNHMVSQCDHGTLAEQLSRIPDRYLSHFYRRLERGRIDLERRRRVIYVPTTDDFLDKEEIRYTDGTTLSERLDAIIDGRRFGEVPDF